MRTTGKQKTLLILVASFLPVFLVYQLNSLLRVRQYLAVCNNLRRIQTALNLYYDRYAAYPAATAYNSKGEIVGAGDIRSFPCWLRAVENSWTRSTI